MSLMSDAMLWVDGDLAVLGCICAYKTRNAARPAVRSLKRRFRRVEAHPGPLVPDHPLYRLAQVVERREAIA